MLYNPKWENETKAFELDNLIHWLEGQPRFKVYNYTECDDCLLARYFTAQGFEHVMVTPDTVIYRMDASSAKLHQLPWGFNEASSPLTVFSIYGWALLKARICKWVS